MLFLLQKSESPAQREKGDGPFGPEVVFSRKFCWGGGGERRRNSNRGGVKGGRAYTHHPHQSWAENTIMTEWMYAWKWPQPVYVLSIVLLSCSSVHQLTAGMTGICVEGIVQEEAHICLLSFHFPQLSKHPPCLSLGHSSLCVGGTGMGEDPTRRQQKVDEI